MPSFTTLVSLLAFIAAAAAQDPNFDSINTPVKGAKVPAGQPFTITWTLLSATTPTGPITITLIGGTATDLLTPIAAIGHTNNEDLKFVWNVDPGLGAEPIYGLKISLDANTTHFQYSQPFQIVGGSVVSSSHSAGTPSSKGSGGGSATLSSATSSGGSATSVKTTTTSTPTTTATVLSTSASTSTTNTVATQHPTNGTASHTALPTASGNKTTSTAPPKTTSTAPPKATSGATALGVTGLGALAVALVASAAMHWGL